MARGAEENGTVYLLGAGPGDPELLTLRARRRLAEADLVLYDALVHPDVLAHARPDAELAFVGKRAGRPSERQARINERMMAAARAGRTVVRLKGGDPFLFGRGSEEAEALAAAGIPFEVVPGVPSPLAAAAYGGFSLTHRRLGSSVLYLTATESVEKARSSHDWARLAQGAETLVIFMGMRKIEALMGILEEHGRPPSTPALVIQWASTPRQRTVVGTIGDIADKARAAQLGLPSLVVVGDVVTLRDELRWFDRRPLFGRRVLVTRPAEQSEDFARMLRDEGAEPVRLPAIRIEDPEDRAPLAAAVSACRDYRWVVFTSANGVDRFFREVARQDLDARVLGASRICAIGPATDGALRARGVRADVIPDEYRGEAAAQAILDAETLIATARVLLPRAAVARDALPDALREAGADVDVVPAYRAVGPGRDGAIRLRDHIHNRQVEVLSFTSPSTVERVAEALGEHESVVGDGFTVACIGPITGDAARARGWPVHVEATEYTARGLTDALVAHYAALEEPPK